MSLIRHSSRRAKLDRDVLQQRLEGAVSYDRIAGYFRSSLFEVAGEALKSVTGKVRIICNSDLDVQDVVTAATAQAGQVRAHNNAGYQIHPSGYKDTAKPPASGWNPGTYRERI